MDTAALGDWVTKTLTFGGVGIWTLVIMAIIGWWKGLPAVLEAITNRQSKIEDRMDKRLKEADDRFKEQIEAADKRHEDCIKGQESLRRIVDDQGQRIEKQSHQISGQADTIAKLQEDIAGYRNQIRQLQVSSLRTAGQSVPDIIMDGMLGQLDRIPEKGQ